MENDQQWSFKFPTKMWIERQWIFEEEIALLGSEKWTIQELSKLCLKNERHLQYPSWSKELFQIAPLQSSSNSTVSKGSSWDLKYQIQWSLGSGMTMLAYNQAILIKTIATNYYIIYIQLPSSIIISTTTVIQHGHRCPPFFLEHPLLVVSCGSVRSTYGTVAVPSLSTGTSLNCGTQNSGISLSQWCPLVPWQWMAAVL